MSDLQAASGSTPKAAWTGTLNVDIPELGLSSVVYRLRAGKVHSDKKPVSFERVDTRNNKKVVGKEVVESTITVVVPQAVPITAETPATSSTATSWKSATTKYFYEEDLTEDGRPRMGSVDIPRNFVVDKQIEDGEIIEPFDRTETIEVTPSNFVPLDRIEEYKEKETYQLGANTNTKVRELPERIQKLARHLLDKQTALISFFSWGRGYEYYTAVIYPYESENRRQILAPYETR